MNIVSAILEAYHYFVPIEHGGNRRKHLENDAT